MYRNLEAEMAREGILKKDISRCLDLRYATVIDKMKGRTQFSISEAFRLKDRFFPGLTIEYLFETSERTELNVTDNCL